jgi:hypothetical protein
MAGMDWWLPFSAGAAACVALVYVISAARGRGPRAVGWGAAPSEDDNRRVLAYLNA